MLLTKAVFSELLAETLILKPRACFSTVDAFHINSDVQSFPI